MYALLKKSRPQSGFTLTEMAIVLGIVGIVISAIWVAAKQMSSGRNVQKATTQVMQILNGYKNLYAAHGIDYKTDGTEDDKQITCIGVMNGYFPPDMILSGTTCANTTASPSILVQTPWGNSSYAAIYERASHNDVIIEYMGIPQSACVGIMAAVSTNPDLIDESIVVTGGGVWPNRQYLPPAGTGVPFTISDIAADCTGTGNNNNILMGFKAH